MSTIVTVSTLKIGKREFVVVPRKDFERLRRKAELTAKDARDVAESSRRMKERGGSTLEEVRKRLKARAIARSSSHLGKR
jgi:hypothetical protein